MTTCDLTFLEKLQFNRSDNLYILRCHADPVRLQIVPYPFQLVEVAHNYGVVRQVVVM